jgi:hypothetical protein
MNWTTRASGQESCQLSPYHFPGSVADHESFRTMVRPLFLNPSSILSVHDLGALAGWAEQSSSWPAAGLKLSRPYNPPEIVVIAEQLYEVSG